MNDISLKETLCTSLSMDHIVHDTCISHDHHRHHKSPSISTTNVNDMSPESPSSSISTSPSMSAIEDDTDMPLLNVNDTKFDAAPIVQPVDIIDTYRKEIVTILLAYRDKYTFVNVLEDSIFGQILLVRDEVKGKNVVMKVSHKAIIHERTNVLKTALYENVRNEIAIMHYIQSNGRTSHRYIAKMYTAFEDDKCVYATFQYAASGDLFYYIRSFHEPSRIVEQRAKNVFRQLVEAVQWLHIQGIAHMDLSVENICLDAHLNVKLIDFGIARLNPRGSGLGAFKQDALRRPCGKANYMSPELTSNLPWDAFKNDMYALGVVLHVMVTGVFPQSPKDNMSMPNSHIHNIITGSWMSTTNRSQKWHAAVYGELSLNVLNLIDSLITPALVRLSCRDVLAHPWLTT